MKAETQKQEEQFCLAWTQWLKGFPSYRAQLTDISPTWLGGEEGKETNSVSFFSLG